MRKFLFVAFTFIVFGAYADTITLNWMNENGTTAQTTTCESGGNITLPSAPSKPGYTFTGWKIPPYIPIEYIENSSNAYVNIGVPIDFNTKIISHVFNYATNGNSTCALVSGVSNIFSVSFYNGTISINFGRANQYLRVGRDILLNISKDGLFYNDTLYSSNVDMFTSQTAYIFGRGGNTTANCVIRIYSLQIYQNNILVHDYVPALDADNVVSLYDKVDGTFLYNAGTGELVGGPIIDYE